MGGASKCITAHYSKIGWKELMSDVIPATAILEIDEVALSHKEIMEEPKPIQVAQIYDQEQNPMNGRVYSEDGIAPTLRTPTGGLSEPCILGYTRDDKGNVTSRHEKEIAGTLHTSTGSGGNTDQFIKEHVIGSMQANAMRGSIDGVSPCLTEAMGMGGGQIPMIVQNGHGFNKGETYSEVAPTITSSAFQDSNHLMVTRYRIRKLTPRECFRLMNMDDSDIDKIEAHRIKVALKNGTVKEKPIPKSAKYKLAGNSIVVSCLYHIFHQMFIAEPPEPKPIQKSLFDF